MKKRTYIVPITLICFLLLIADLIFKGAIYKQLPAHLQEAVDEYVGK